MTILLPFCVVATPSAPPSAHCGTCLLVPFTTSEQSRMGSASQSNDGGNTPLSPKSFLSWELVQPPSSGPPSLVSDFSACHGADTLVRSCSAQGSGCPVVEASCRVPTSSGVHSGPEHHEELCGVDGGSKASSGESVDASDVPNGFARKEGRCRHSSVGDLSSLDEADVVHCGTTKVWPPAESMEFDAMLAQEVGLMMHVTVGVASSEPAFLGSSQCMQLGKLGALNSVQPCASKAANALIWECAGAKTGIKSLASFLETDVPSFPFSQRAGRASE